MICCEYNNLETFKKLILLGANFKKNENYFNNFMIRNKNSKLKEYINDLKNTNKKNNLSLVLGNKIIYNWKDSGQLERRFLLFLLKNEDNI